MLGRPVWPVLDKGQDPDSLEARVAFHLHRLNLLGDRLRNIGFLPRSHLGELTAGRVPLTERDVANLALRLHVAIEELNRPLTQPESDEWAFYRHSATNVTGTWRRAEALWKAAGVTNMEAAVIVGFNYRTLSRCLTGEDPFALSYEAALRLSVAIGIEQGPAAFIEEPQQNLENPSR